MLAFTYVLVATLVVSSIVGCSQQQPVVNGDAVTLEGQVTPPDLGNDFTMAATDSVGGRLYTAACASCHEQGLNRAPHRSMLLLMSPHSIYRAMSEGVMQAQSSSLSDEDKVAVAEFLARRPISAEKVNNPPPQCAGDALTFDYAEPPIFSGWGLTPQSTHAIPADVAGLNKQNVNQLKVKWSFAYPGALRARSAPALAGGAIYVGSHDGAVYAFDRETGCVRWTFHASAEVRTGIVISPWEQGERQLGEKQVGDRPAGDRQADASQADASPAEPLA